jgi:hypothetical protein
VTKLPAIRTRFALNLGNVDPTLVSKYIALEPTRVLTKGDKREPPRPPVAESAWEIEVAKQNLYSIDESLALILDIVWPNRTQLVSFCRDNNISCLFVTAVWITDEVRPVYELSRVNLKKMSELEASWIMDLA